MGNIVSNYEEQRGGDASYKGNMFQQIQDNHRIIVMQFDPK